MKEGSFGIEEILTSNLSLDRCITSLSLSPCLPTLVLNEYGSLRNGIAGYPHTMNGACNEIVG